MKLLSFDSHASYRIRVQGQLDPSWSDRLEGLHICPAEPESLPPVMILEGELPDQAALIGVLNTLYDLHLTLLSVDCTNAV